MKQASGSVAMMLDATGVIRAEGIINCRQHSRSDRWTRCDFEQVCPHDDVTEAAHASD